MRLETIDADLEAEVGSNVNGIVYGSLTFGAGGGEGRESPRRIRGTHLRHMRLGRRNRGGCLPSVNGCGLSFSLLITGHDDGAEQIVGTSLQFLRQSTSLSASTQAPAFDCDHR